MMASSIDWFLSYGVRDDEWQSYIVTSGAMEFITAKGYCFGPTNGEDVGLCCEPHILQLLHGVIKPTGRGVGAAVKALIDGTFNTQII